MALTPRLDQRQSQSLAMTPQLQQAIKLLQLSNIELNEFVEKVQQEQAAERQDSWWGSRWAKKLFLSSFENLIFFVFWGWGGGGVSEVFGVQRN